MIFQNIWWAESNHLAGHLWQQQATVKNPTLGKLRTQPLYMGLPGELADEVPGESPEHPILTFSKGRFQNQLLKQQVEAFSPPVRLTLTYIYHTESNVEGEWGQVQPEISAVINNLSFHCLVHLSGAYESTGGKI